MKKVGTRSDQYCWRSVAMAQNSSSESLVSGANSNESNEDETQETVPLHEWTTSMIDEANNDKQLVPKLQKDG